MADGVVLGSTYRVVSCRCARDPSLADQAEWCAWCRCRKCGGKHLPPERGRFYTHAAGQTGQGQGGDGADLLEDFSTDLIPLAALPLVAYLGTAWVERSPYVYLYLLAGVAVAFLLRETAYFKHAK